MDRVKRFDYSPSALMSAVDVARYLLDTCPTLRFFESYMFGSAVTGIGADYDILIVGPSGGKLNKLKCELNRAGAELPLDILCMLPIEEKDTDFIKSQKCISLTQLAASS